MMYVYIIMVAINGIAIQPTMKERPGAGTGSLRGCDPKTEASGMKQKLQE
jgi:hypothetical protein